MFVATLVAPPSRPILDDALLSHAAQTLHKTSAAVSSTAWLAPGEAADLYFDGITPQAARTALLGGLGAAPVDVIVQQRARRRRAMLIADMDSTMITVECIDELADLIGRKTEVAAVTEAAMRGDLDFVQALDSRVALLAGLAEDELQRCYDERVTMTPGAQALVRTMAAGGAHTVLVSGGFTFFTRRVAQALGFALDRSNSLELADGRLTGTVARPIVTAQVKRQTLLDEAARLGLATDQVLAVGDGANDIPMIEAAGLGVAFHAKPRTVAAARASIRHGDLSALLFAQGYRRDQWWQQP